ncbi:hypothetical protein PMAYCL1PPCAC_18337, partial [Pristionchus mayeri]
MSSIPLMDFSHLEDAQLIPTDSLNGGNLPIVQQGRKLSRSSFNQKSIDEVDIMKMRKFTEAAATGDTKTLQEMLTADNSAAVKYKDLSEV